MSDASPCDNLHIDDQLPSPPPIPPLPGQLPELLPQHLEDLRGSGLSDQQIADCGFCSVSDVGAIQEILRCEVRRPSLEACLLIPYRGPDGRATGYCRLKPDKPRADRKNPGRRVKYESPRGGGNRAFFPPATLAILQEVSIPLILTEGEKKAAKADQEGLFCIGLSGVWSWCKKRKRDPTTGKAKGRFELIDDLVAVAWDGREVFICFDSDRAENTSVCWAEWHLSQTLADQGAAVRIIELPARAAVKAEEVPHDQ